MQPQKRAALYARVSTADKGQDPETQLRQLREYCHRRGFINEAELVDVASGTRDDRPRYKEMLAAVRKRKFDVVLVWRFDRFARSTRELVNALQEFQELGVDFISYHENIDTTTPTGKLTFHIMAALAEFESSLISARVKAGMARARAEGKKIGREKITKQQQGAIMSLMKDGVSMRQISKRLKISYGTVYNYTKKFNEASEKFHKLLG